MTESNARAIRARIVFPIVSPPIHDGVVTIGGDRIVAVEPYRQGMTVDDRGDVALLPGMVNAHAHLELSDLDAPLGDEHPSMTDWVVAVLAHRAAADYSHETAVRRGIDECRRSGTAVVADIVQADWSPEWIAGEGVDVFALREMIGWTPDRARETIRQAEAFMNTTDDIAGIVRGLSPHAPQTTSRGLLAAAVEQSRKHGAPIAMHLAETPHERELLETHSGPLRDMMAAIGPYDPASTLLGRGFTAYLDALSNAARSLVIHGNDLDGKEIALLGEHASNMAVVYCPRSHDHFGHAAYPLAEMIALGVTLALGTDSRASTPCLSLFEEVRFAARRHPDVSPVRLLEAATLGGAKALGVAHRYGALASGMSARMVEVPLAQTADDPHECLLLGGEPSAL